MKRGQSGRGLRVAIDGPSGAGKSTLARALARRLRLPYVDTGAMYRALAWKSLQAGEFDAEAMLAALDETCIEVQADPDAFRVRVDGRDVTDALRRPAVSDRASRVAALPEVREWLVPRQRELAAGGGVLEGRDIGTVVLPDADVKLFVTAAEGERLRRRAAQLGPAESGRVEAEVVERDRRDRSRSVSPLLRAADAHVVDTSGEAPEETLERILEVVEEARSGAGRGSGSR